MTLQDQLMSDLKSAMRAHDEVRRLVIRLVRAEIQNEEISKGRIIGDDGVVEVLSRMARKYRESIALYIDHNRPDRANREELELNVVLEYLPEQLSREQLLALAGEAARDVGARGPEDKGKVMGKLMPQIRGRAEGTKVNSLVGELLESMAG